MMDRLGAGMLFALFLWMIIGMLLFYHTMFCVKVFLIIVGIAAVKVLLSYLINLLRTRIEEQRNRRLQMETLGEIIVKELVLIPSVDTFLKLPKGTSEVAVRDLVLHDLRAFVSQWKISELPKLRTILVKRLTQHKNVLETTDSRQKLMTDEDVKHLVSMIDSVIEERYANPTQEIPDLSIEERQHIFKQNLDKAILFAQRKAAEEYGKKYLDVDHPEIKQQALQGKEQRFSLVEQDPALALLFLLHPEISPKLTNEERRIYHDKSIATFKIDIFQY
jgi:hypothetical protein